MLASADAVVWRAFSNKAAPVAQAVACRRVLAVMWIAVMTQSLRVVAPLYSIGCAFSNLCPFERAAGGF
jgi:hypothetical protein